MPNTITDPLTASEGKRLAAHEKTIKRGFTEFIATGTALLDINESRLYRGTHATFVDYCKEVWNFSPQHAFRLISGAETVKTLAEAGATILPSSESVARPLASLAPADKPKAWQSAVESSAQAGRPAPTAADVKAAAVEVEVIPPRKANRKAASSSPRLPAIDEHEYAEAIKRLRSILGHGIKSAIETGVLPGVDKKDAITWSKESDEDIPKINRLIAGNRWSVKEAVHFLKAMPDSKHRIERLCWLALAEDGWEGVIDGVHFVLTLSRRRK